MLLDFLFPNYDCLICGTELNGANNIRICDSCAERLPINTEPVVLANEKAKQYFRTAYAPFNYQPPISELVMKLKYADNGDVAAALAPYMSAVLSRNAIDAETTLIPVPLCKARKKRRGYNQSELLIKEIAAILNLKTDSNILLRTKATEPQKKMNIKEREENLCGAFEIAPEEKIKGRRFIIVDDVFTSGSTVNECAKILKKAGAKSIDALVIASVLQF